jgi:hypothetical protein
MARKQFLLRIDPELWKQLEKWAADDLRSVNAQVEWLLREAMRKRKGSRARHDQASHKDGDEHEDESDSALVAARPRAMNRSVAAEPAALSGQSRK